MKKAILIILALASSCFAGEQRDAGLNRDFEVQVQFREPVYPEGADRMLLRELVLFFDEREQPRLQEDWENLLTRMREAKVPRMATRVDLKITKDKIQNVSNEAVLVVLRHLHPLVPQRSMNLNGVEYRAHWLTAKSSLQKREIGFGTGGTVLEKPRLLKNPNR